MTRKNLLRGLLPEPGVPAPPLPAPAADPPALRGAVGAVSRSLADLKARALVEIDPALIDAGGLTDRLETDDAEDARLRASIAEHGQQVPVLVRPHPEQEGRYQIVFGRRRVLALRDLGRPVKALVRDLDDRAALIAQGQENTARRDLSFIEKANFARQMADAGYDRKTVCDALSVDKTVISRMLAVAERLGPDLIEAVGAAPGVGRDRWMWVCEQLDRTGTPPEEAAGMVNLLAASEGSDARFEALARYLSGAAAQARAAARTPPAPLRGHGGRHLGSVVAGGGHVTIRLRRSAARGFEDWLVENLPELHRRWAGETDDPG